MNKPNTVIGTRFKRVDARRKVTGETKFLTDIKVDNMLHAAPVFSQVAYGHLLSISTGVVENDPDFVAFYSAKDIPGENQVGVILEDQPLMAAEVVRFIGDSVGILVAKTAESAQRLSRLIVINIEPLPPIFSIKESSAGCNLPEFLRVVFFESGQGFFCVKFDNG